MNRLVILAPNWLGDAVMALPAIADVRRGSAEAWISVAARPLVAQLFNLVPDVGEVVALGDGSRLFYRPTPVPQVALLLPNSFRSALVARRAGIPERWGYRAGWRGPLLTKAIDRAPGTVHQVEYYQRLVRALGFPNGPGVPRIVVSDQVREASSLLLKREGWDGSAPVIALAPGVAYGDSRRWSPRYFADLARTLAADGARPVLVGSAADARTGREIESVVADPRTVLNVIGRTDVPTLAGVLTLARALVSNDSGAMHLGAALGVPVTAVFGPTDERVTSPRSSAATDVLSHPVWCRPCRLRECPLDHRCMRGVRVDVVAASARRML